MGTTISGEPPDNLHCYLYALQTADTQTCTSSINPLSRSFTSNGGEGSVNVTAPSGCGWTATSNATWIDITSAAGGSGNGVVTYVVRENPTTSLRRGTISIAGQAFTVSQDGVKACTFSISPTSQAIPRKGGTGTVNVTAPSGCSWTATSNSGWITVSSVSSASGNGVVTYLVSANNSDLVRVGTMLIAGKTVTVKQKPR